MSYKNKAKKDILQIPTNQVESLKICYKSSGVNLSGVFNWTFKKFKLNKCQFYDANINSRLVFISCNIIF